MAFTTRIADGAASIHTRAALEASRIAYEEDELEAFIDSTLNHLKGIQREAHS